MSNFSRSFIGSSARLQQTSSRQSRANGAAQTPTETQTTPQYPAARLKDAFGNQANYHVAENYLMVEQTARLAPTNFRYACKLPLPINAAGRPMSPIVFQAAPEVAAIFGVDFDGSHEPEILCGRFSEELIKNSKVFMVADSYQAVVKAPDVLIKVIWNAEHHGKEASLAKVLGAKHFNSVTSNTGCRGIDYWILPWTQAKDPQLAKDCVLMWARERFPQE